MPLPMPGDEKEGGETWDVSAGAGEGVVRCCGRCGVKRRSVTSSRMYGGGGVVEWWSGEGRQEQDHTRVYSGLDHGLDTMGLDHTHGVFFLSVFLLLDHTCFFSFFLSFFCISALLPPSAPIMRAPFTSRTIERLMRDTAMIAHDAVTRGLRPYLERGRKEV